MTRFRTVVSSWSWIASDRPPRTRVPFASVLASWSLGTPMYERTAFAWITAAGVVAAGEVLILPQIWPGALMYLLGAAAALRWPEATSWIQPTVYAVNSTILVRALRRHAAASRVTTPAA